MHLTKDFVVYSESNSNHIKLIQGDEVFCERNARVLQDTDDLHIDQICRFIRTQYCS